jgi:hypothetical protein
MINGAAFRDCECRRYDRRREGGGRQPRNRFEPQKLVPNSSASHLPSLRIRTTHWLRSRIQDDAIEAGPSLHTINTFSRERNMTSWIGIDVSKLHLDAGWIEDGKKVHRKVRNSKKGFAALMAEVPESAHFVMEATGTYYFNLALFLHQAQRFVAVVNPSCRRALQRETVVGTYRETPERAEI